MALQRLRKYRQAPACIYLYARLSPVGSAAETQEMKCTFVRYESPIFVQFVYLRSAIFKTLLSSRGPMDVESHVSLMESGFSSRCMGGIHKTNICSGLVSSRST